MRSPFLLAAACSPTSHAHPAHLPPLIHAQLSRVPPPSRQLNRALALAHGHAAGRAARGRARPGRWVVRVRLARPERARAAGAW